MALVCISCIFAPTQEPFKKDALPHNTFLKKKLTLLQCWADLDQPRPKINDELTRVMLSVIFHH